MRGKPSGRRRRGDHGRVHPRACGGNADIAIVHRNLRTAVHPRACGGNARSSSRSAGQWGVHPRACGGNGGRVDKEDQSRSIPARAGETSSAGAAEYRPPAGSIPARAGEAVSAPTCCSIKGPSPKRLTAAAGPSPRVRGKLDPSRPSSGATGVHPRACGGSDRWIPGLGHLPEGSIPARAGEAANRDCWIRIPARAGEACLRGPSPRVRGNAFRPRELACLAGPSPRVRGKRDCYRLQQWSRQGPSPRVRGKHLAPSVHRLHQRSIPARAGETRQPVPGRDRRPDGSIPARAGETRESSRSRPGTGSIPARAGETDAEQQRGAVCGSIPARAGETGKKIG